MKPAAGVTPARPQIAPLIAAVVDGFFDLFQESKIQTTAEVTAPICVTRKALAAKEPDASALPALNPNQPNQSKDAPRTASGILCGTMISGPKFFRRPKTSAAAIEANPADVWITIPPAKSYTPRFASQPPPQTQCARGKYTTKLQATIKITKPLNFTRSANAPVIRRGVITANIIWNVANVTPGIDGA